MSPQIGASQPAVSQPATRPYSPVSATTPPFAPTSGSSTAGSAPLVRPSTSLTAANYAVVTGRKYSKPWGRRTRSHRKRSNRNCRQEGTVPGWRW